MDPMGYLKSMRDTTKLIHGTSAHALALYIIIYNIPLPETNELPVKTGGWKMKFPFEAISRGKLLGWRRCIHPKVNILGYDYTVKPFDLKHYLLAKVTRIYF